MASHRQKSIFHRKVGEALSVCQLLEEVLKLYISVAFWRIAKELKGRIAFGFRGEDYQEAALERLLQAFRRLSDKKDIIERLEAFRKERNYLAHRAAGEYIDAQHTKLTHHKDMMKRLKALEDEGYSLFDEILRETRRIRELGNSATFNPFDLRSKG